jgi:hypothetical protein
VSTALCGAAPLPSGPFQNISQKLEIAFSRSNRLFQLLPKLLFAVVAFWGRPMAACKMRKPQLT